MAKYKTVDDFLKGEGVWASVDTFRACWNFATEAAEEKFNSTLSPINKKKVDSVKAKTFSAHISGKPHMLSSPEIAFGDEIWSECIKANSEKELITAADYCEKINRILIECYGKLGSVAVSGVIEANKTQFEAHQLYKCFSAFKKAEEASDQKRPAPPVDVVLADGEDLICECGDHIKVGEEYSVLNKKIYCKICRANII